MTPFREAPADILTARDASTQLPDPIVYTPAQSHIRSVVDRAALEPLTSTSTDQTAPARLIHAGRSRATRRSASYGAEPATAAPSGPSELLALTSCIETGRRGPTKRRRKAASPDLSSLVQSNVAVV